MAMLSIDGRECFNRGCTNAANRQDHFRRRSHDEIPPLSGQAYIKAGRQNSLFDPNQIAFQVTIAASVCGSTAASD